VCSAIRWLAVTPEGELRQGSVLAGTEYSVYILRCADDTYYTGIAANVARRIAEHESGPRGAKYLKGRGPLQLVYAQFVGDRSVASQLEYRIKRLDRSGKQALIDGRISLQSLRPDQDSAAG
jgi:putative endonuclease